MREREREGGGGGGGRGERERERERERFVALKMDVLMCSGTCVFVCICARV